jgi:phospholipase C
VDILFLSSDPLPLTGSQERYQIMMKHFCKTAGLLAAASILPTLWAAAPTTTTPIKYVVVIFQENNSFDHYFGTYPNALCPAGTASSAAICFQFPASGESPFVPLPNTPSVNGITPAVSNVSAVPPFRLDRSQAVTCDQDNAYNAEQNAYNSGAVNLFPANASLESGPPRPAAFTNLI